MKRMKSLLLLLLVGGVVRGNEYSLLKDLSDEIELRTEEYQLHINHDEQEVVCIDDNKIEDVTVEYEQHVCDTIKPAQPSQLSVFFTTIGCSLLLKYCIMQEMAKRYWNNFTSSMSNWFSFIVNRA